MVTVFCVFEETSPQYGAERLSRICSTRIHAEAHQLILKNRSRIQEFAVDVAEVDLLLQAQRPVSIGCTLGETTSAFTLDKHIDYATYRTSLLGTNYSSTWMALVESVSAITKTAKISIGLNSVEVCVAPQFLEAVREETYYKVPISIFFSVVPLDPDFVGFKIYKEGVLVYDADSETKDTEG